MRTTGETRNIKGVGSSSQFSRMDKKCEKLQMADEKYVNGKISVWWDIQNCAVPKACDPDSIAQNISSALAKVNYCGPISISAYGNTKGISYSVQHALNSTGISLNHVPAGVKDASDKKILVDMLLWAVDNPAPATYLLISGDRDFSNALHQLRMRRYNILLAQPRHVSAPLVAAATSVWRWTSLLAGQPPLTDGVSAQLSSQISTSVPSQTQSTKVSPADSSRENSSPRNQKFPKEGSGTDVSHKGKQVCENPSQPSISPSSSNSKEAIALQAAPVVDMRLAELAHLPLKRTSNGPIEVHGGKFPCIQLIYPSPENPSHGNAALKSPSQHNEDTQCSPSPTPVLCNFCMTTGHLEESCRRKHGLCLRCGDTNHELSTCPYKADQRCGTSEHSTKSNLSHVAAGHQLNTCPRKPSPNTPPTTRFYTLAYGWRGSSS